MSTAEPELIGGAIAADQVLVIASPEPPPSHSAVPSAAPTVTSFTAPTPGVDVTSPLSFGDAPTAPTTAVLHLDTAPGAITDTVRFAYTNGGWPALEECYREVLLSRRHDISNLVRRAIEQLIAENFGVLRAVEAMARAIASESLSVTSRALDHDAPLLLAEPNLGSVRQSEKWWNLLGPRPALASSELVTDLRRILREQRGAIERLRNARLVSSYLTEHASLPEAPARHAALELSASFLAVRRALGQVGLEHPVVHRLLYLDPDKPDEMAQGIASVLNAAADAVEVVSDSLTDSAGWPKRAPVLSMLGDQRRRPGELGSNPIQKIIRDRAPGPWSMPLVIDRACVALGVVEGSPGHRAVVEAKQGDHEDSGIGLVLGAGTVALDLVCPPAGVAANLLLGAWPLIVDWSKYRTNEAAVLASLDPDLPLAVPGNFRAIVVDMLNLTASVIPGWKGFAVGGFSQLVAIGAQERR